MESCPLALASRRFIRKTRIGIEWEPSSREIESGNGIGERRVRDGGRSVIDIDNEAVVVVLRVYQCSTGHASANSWGVKK